MLTLYLILLAIAILGFIALTIIAISYYKPKQKKSMPPTLEEENEPEETTIAIHEPIVLSQQHMATNAVNDEDATLASLGFSALDPGPAATPPEPEVEPEPTLTKPFCNSSPPLEKGVASVSERGDFKAAKPIVLYLLAPRDRPFTGYELLQALLSADLRYGEKRIFHRHEPIEGAVKKILFSVASAIEPGIFDMANIGGFSCPGLCIFMAPNKVADPISTFELMLETAQQLADDLDGELCNAYREPLTEEELEEHRIAITC